MHPSLDGILAGVSRHGLAMHIEQGQLASSVVIKPAEISAEPHLVGVALFVNIFSLTHHQTSNKRENTEQSQSFLHFKIGFKLYNLRPGEPSVASLTSEVGL